MNPETIKDSIQAVIEGLTPLAQQLQIPIGKLFEYAVRQNYVQAINGIWQSFVALPILTLVFWKMGDRFSSEEWMFVPYFLVEIALVFLWFIVFLDVIPEIVARFINPEYMAFQDLWKLISSAGKE